MDTKVVIDLNVIPKGWTLDDFKRVLDEEGIAVIDTFSYDKDFSPIQIINGEDIEIQTLTEYNARQ